MAVGRLNSCEDGILFMCQLLCIAAVYVRLSNFTWIQDIVMFCRNWICHRQREVYIPVCSNHSYIHVNVSMVHLLLGSWSSTTWLGTIGSHNNFFTKDLGVLQRHKTWRRILAESSTWTLRWECIQITRNIGSFVVARCNVTFTYVLEKLILMLIVGKYTSPMD